MVMRLPARFHVSINSQPRSCSVISPSCNCGPQTPIQAGTVAGTLFASHASCVTLSNMQRQMHRGVEAPLFRALSDLRINSAVKCKYQESVGVLLVCPFTSPDSG